MENGTYAERSTIVIITGFINEDTCWCASTLAFIFCHDPVCHRGRGSTHCTSAESLWETCRSLFGRSSMSTRRLDASSRWTDLRQYIASPIKWVPPMYYCVKLVGCDQTWMVRNTHAKEMQRRLSWNVDAFLYSKWHFKFISVECNTAFIVTSSFLYVKRGLLRYTTPLTVNVFVV